MICFSCLDSTRLDLTRLDSTGLDWTRLDSTRLDSTRLDSTRLATRPAPCEQGYATLGEPYLMDRVERIGFNALPAALTGDMWTHVYVHQVRQAHLCMPVLTPLLPCLP